MGQKNLFMDNVRFIYEMLEALNCDFSGNRKQPFTDISYVVDKLEECEDPTDVITLLGTDDFQSLG